MKYVTDTNLSGKFLHSVLIPVDRKQMQLGIPSHLWKELLLDSRETLCTTDDFLKPHK